MAKGLCNFHYQAVYSKKRGREYKAWISMRQRIFNIYDSNYPNYGGRGLTICDSWDDFANFLKDMGKCPKGLQLERVDNEKGYFPDNCKWVSAKEQQRNRRDTKLSLEKAELIRSEYKKGNISQVQLGKLFGVDNTTIYKVVHNKRWT